MIWFSLKASSLDLPEAPRMLKGAFGFVGGLTADGPPTSIDLLKGRASPALLGIIAGHEIGHFQLGVKREGYGRGRLEAEAGAWRWYVRRVRSQGRALSAVERKMIRECFAGYVRKYREGRPKVLNA